jgi:hypothetical protein
MDFTVFEWPWQKQYHVFQARRGQMVLRMSCWYIFSCISNKVLVIFAALVAIVAHFFVIVYRIYIDVAH